MPKATTLDPIFSGLNTEQRRAVEHLSGPLLIIAGAGSGKTRALTHRIAHLIEKGVPPWQILAVTFTNKAADEMKQRIRNLLSITDPDIGNLQFDYKLQATSYKLPTMGTFHSICARILRRDIEHLGRDRKFTIYDEDDQERLMKEVLKGMHIDETELKPRAALAHIGRFKCEALTPKEAQEQASTPRMQKITEVFGQYHAALRRANALDFDDLILEVVRLFREVPEVLNRYQETWRYLNVDEYQDTNHAQYLLISLLAQKERNICVIGDPDQSIYAFRGADIRNILEFEKEYKDATRIKLEQNYRSTQPILTAADAIIAANPNRPEKHMWTQRVEGEKITLEEVRDEHAEAALALETVLRLQREGTPLNEHVILYRTNAQSRLFEEACMRTGTPYRIVGSMKFYARKEVKDVLAYLHVLLNPADTVSLLRILNVPSRHIGDTTLQKLHTFSTTQSLSLWETLQSATQIDALNEGTKERIGKFTSLINRLQEASQKEVVSSLALRLLDTTDMEKWYRDDTEEGESRWQNVSELLSVMHKYDTLPPEVSLISFLEEVALVSEVDKLTNVRGDALTLMTLHLCKGLEFTHVIIAGCEEGILPHSASLFDHAQLEEERRLMYVGMTRAKTHLHLLFARQRMLYGETQANAPSRFLDDLPEEVIERRSDEILSAFAWAAHRTEDKGQRTEDCLFEKPMPDLNVEFNQDITFEAHAPRREFQKGDRVSHPTFGQGTITAKRGNVADIVFDSGKKAKFALNIAPLKRL